MSRIDLKGLGIHDDKIKVTLYACKKVVEIEIVDYTTGVDVSIGLDKKSIKKLCKKLKEIKHKMKEYTGL